MSLEYSRTATDVCPFSVSNGVIQMIFSRVVYCSEYMVATCCVVYYDLQCVAYISLRLKYTEGAVATKEDCTYGNIYLFCT